MSVKKVALSLCLALSLAGQCQAVDKDHNVALDIQPDGIFTLKTGTKDILITGKEGNIPGSEGTLENSHMMGGQTAYFKYSKNAIIIQDEDGKKIASLNAKKCFEFELTGEKTKYHLELVNTCEPKDGMSPGVQKSTAEAHKSAQMGGGNTAMTTHDNKMMQDKSTQGNVHPGAALPNDQKMLGAQPQVHPGMNSNTTTSGVQPVPQTSSTNTAKSVLQQPAGPGIKTEAQVKAEHDAKAVAENKAREDAAVKAKAESKDKLDQAKTDAAKAATGMKESAKTMGKSAKELGEAGEKALESLKN